MTQPVQTSSVSLAYLDTPSGISGDIFLGCLLDAGWPLERLRAVVEALHLPAGSWRVDAQTVMRGPLRATLADVEVIEGDAHRHLSDVTAIIRAGDLPSVVQERAIAVFTRLAEAEARVHNTTPEAIHFHEVGALDAIVDIVGVCAGLHELGIERLYASPLPLGHGWAQTMHGRIPLPAPATLELLAAAGAPTVPAPGSGELVTPTGAALLAELADFSQPRMTLRRIGYGAGRKEFAWPNVARLWVGEEAAGGQIENQRQSALSASSAFHSSLVVIETNIDDMNPELYEPVRERLFGVGVLDVWTTAIGMKKGRPGTLLSVLAAAEKEAELARLILRETTTLGVRVYPVKRHIAEREFRTVETRYGPVQVKVKLLDGERLGAKPEYDDCKRLADAAGVPVRMVYEAALAAGLESTTAPPLIDKVCPVLLRRRDGKLQILAFRHPLAGGQIVKGTLEEGEEPAAAVLRELAEESGIDDARAVSPLGRYDDLEDGQRWHVFLCQVERELPNEWTFFTTDGGGHNFAFFWHNLDEIPSADWYPLFCRALGFIRRRVAERDNANLGVSLFA